jgi:tRNA threonylcarbamoyladenosine modification (KEOPS) complex  Pcc1 subunit
LEAEITLQYEEVNVAKAIARAVSPDNVKTPSGLSITTVSEGKRVVTSIKCRGKLSTFIATIDDLLFCASVAERALHTTKKLK